MTLLAFLFALLGFVLLALAMDRHARDLIGRPPSHARRRRMRAGAILALTACYGLTITGWGVVLGSILAYALMSLAAAVVLLAVSHRTVRRSGKE